LSRQWPLSDSPETKYGIGRPLHSRYEKAKFNERPDNGRDEEEGP
jgi:hypothetical protein